jgi:hypothetical protein
MVTARHMMNAMPPSAMAAPNTATGSRAHAVENAQHAGSDPMLDSWLPAISAAPTAAEAPISHFPASRIRSLGASDSATAIDPRH